MRTPQPITKLEEDMPECYKEFMELAEKLENHYRDMQDMEFTIQEGKLYFLQTRNGKRTAPAAIQIFSAASRASTVSDKIIFLILGILSSSEKFKYFISYWNND